MLMLILTTILGCTLSLHAASDAKDSLTGEENNNIALVADVLGHIYANNDSPAVATMFAEKLYLELEIAKLKADTQSDNTYSIMLLRKLSVKTTLACLEPGVIIHRPNKRDREALRREAKESLECWDK